MNVNSTGAKKIMTNGVNFAFWTANTTVLFVYDGTYWQVASTPVYANTVTIGNTAGRNVYIDNDSIDIRNGTTVLATFEDKKIELGKNSDESQIYLCGERGYIGYDETYGLQMHSQYGLGFYSEDGDEKIGNIFIDAGNYGGIRLWNGDYSFYLDYNTEKLWEYGAPLGMSLGLDAPETYAEISMDYAPGTQDIQTVIKTDSLIINSPTVGFVSDYVGMDSLTFLNHDSPVGTMITKTGGTDYTSDLSSGKETWKTIASITIPAGKWIVYYRARYQNSTSGTHLIRSYFTTSSSSTSFSNTQNGSATNYLYATDTVIVSVSDDTTYYLRGYASVAGTWFRGTSAELRIVAIRLV
ncbi:MAG: hypothetical protein GX763_09175 [Clostridiaceae bacterium]|nr:hypothetical protein [Clostridiaceae bacterium]